MDVTLANRLRKLPPYLFADLRRKMRDAQARGVEVLRIDIGDPDIPTPEPIVAEMARAAADEADGDRHRYGCDRPVEAYPRAVRDFYRRRWSVELGADQVVACRATRRTTSPTSSPAR